MEVKAIYAPATPPPTVGIAITLTLWEAQQIRSMWGDAAPSFRQGYDLVMATLGQQLREAGL